MRLQSVILPENEQNFELYFRGKPTLAAGETLSFDTYFNSFSYTKYRDYTTVKSVTFSCNISGSARLSLCVFDGSERVICETICEGKCFISAEFLQLPENGFLYPKITASSNCEFLGGEYSAECEPEKISCCIAICTFKREQYVLKNIELLKNSDFTFVDRVFVVDNGNTLDCGALSDEFVKVLPNKNYGGSGGFTRGLIEAHDGGFSHVILMDDDVEFFTETIEQMTIFVSLLKKEYSDSWFSTAMIPFDKPWEQFELGAEWNGKEAVVHKHHADIRNNEVLLDNLDNFGVEYGGWWTLLMPVSVTDIGLPYPFFIKFDDVEYGLRKQKNTQIITMNGIAVRHEAFDRKKSFAVEYYNLRNELAVNAIYGKYGAFGAVRRFIYEAAKHLCLYRYDNIPIVFRAVRDFMKGVDFFLNSDEEQLNNELIKTVPRLVPLGELPEWNERLRCDEHSLDKQITAAMVLTLGGHLIPSFLLKKDVSAVPLSRCGTKECFGRKCVIQYQLGGDKGILTQRSFGKFLKYGFLTFLMGLKLAFGYGKAKKQFISRKNEITSFDFWRKHLDI
jgi:GT2 family glycosyltransferase